MIEQYMGKARPSVILQVTRDKYELPIRMANTVDEMARLTGLTRSAIYKSIERKNGPFIKVYIDEEDE